MIPSYSLHRGTNWPYSNSQWTNIRICNLWKVTWRWKIKVTYIPLTRIIEMARQGPPFGRSFGQPSVAARKVKMLTGGYVQSEAVSLQRLTYVSYKGSVFFNRRTGPVQNRGRGWGFEIRSRKKGGCQIRIGFLKFCTGVVLRLIKTPP